jgi:hypothetical protein
MPPKRIPKPNPRYNEHSSTTEPKETYADFSAKAVAETRKAGTDKTSTPGTTIGNESSSEESVDQIMDALPQTRPPCECFFVLCTRPFN